MATNQDKKINEYKKNPTVAESAYVVGLNSNDENINIPRATLAEIVRQELYSILNASAADQGTTVTKVPVLGGNRIGSSSIADLASVLGAITNSFSLKNASDANSETGNDGMITFCMVRNNVANYPRTNPRGFLIVSRINSGYINQAYWDTKTADIYTRSLALNETWTDWKLVEAT